MHQNVFKRQERKVHLIKKYFPPNGLYSRQHLTAIHPYAACIYHSAVKESLSKSLSLQQSHKKLEFFNTKGKFPL